MTELKCDSKYTVLYVNEICIETNAVNNYEVLHHSYTCVRSDDDDSGAF